MLNNAEQLARFGQGNLEALVKSGEAFAAGLQDLTRQAVTSAQASVEESLSTFRAMTTAKSLHEAIELQNRASRASLERLVHDGGKLTEQSLRLAEQTCAPLSARFHEAVEAFSQG